MGRYGVLKKGIKNSIERFLFLTERGRQVIFVKKKEILGKREIVSPIRKDYQIVLVRRRVNGKTVVSSVITVSICRHFGNAVCNPKLCEKRKVADEEPNIGEVSNVIFI